jgi:hypothetical protein
LILLVRSKDLGHRFGFALAIAGLTLMLAMMHSAFDAVRHSALEASSPNL